MADQPLTHFERTLAAALELEAAEASPGPDCPDPEEILELAEGGGRVPGAVRKFGHVASCAHCRKVYRETHELLRMSEAAGRNAAGGTPTPSRTAVMAAPLFGPTDRHFDWTALSASSSPRPASITWTAVGGAVKLTLWLDGEELVLTAENDRTGLWQMEGSQVRFVSGDGVDLTGELLRYEIVSGPETLSGYLVFPRAGVDRPAEVSLGAYRDRRQGDLECRIASADELADARVAEESLRRARDRTTRLAWADWSRVLGEDLPPQVRAVIERETGKGTGR